MIWRLKIKIKTRILAGFILLAAFSSIMVAFFALRQFGTILKEQILTDLILVAETKEGNFLIFWKCLRAGPLTFLPTALSAIWRPKFSSGATAGSAIFWRNI